MEGQTDYKTTNQTDFIDQEYVYQRPRKRTWTKDDYEKFHHQTDETTFVKSNEKTFLPAERPQPIKPVDSLKPAGEFYTPEKSQPIGN